MSRRVNSFVHDRLTKPKFKSDAVPFTSKLGGERAAGSVRRPRNALLGSVRPLLAHKHRPGKDGPT